MTKHNLFTTTLSAASKILLGISAVVGIWAIYQIFVEKQFFQGGILLAYAGVVVWGMESGLLRRSAPRNDNPTLSPQPSPTGGEGGKQNLENIILDLIREKGSAKREDLLLVIGISRSSLGRLLDDMERRGLIVQIGERKGSYYRLKQ